MADKPEFIAGQYQYPDGYRSDYNYATSTQARFYDQADMMIARALEDGSDTDQVDGWLMDLAAREGTLHG